MKTSPIALFVYNRLKHTKQTIEALQQNPLSSKSNLFIFSDGAKEDAGKIKVQEVRNYLKTITGFKTVTIIERKVNLGLAQSIITGVTEVVNKYGNIIVLEDDLITSPFFLEYMNSALETYKNIENVISIHGYVYPVKKELPETFFIRGADCWGWATWKRGWNMFEHDGKKLLQQLENEGLTKEFDINGAYKYIQMLKDQINDKNDSWAIRWHASAFINNKLTLYPGKSLVQNIGFDNSGTHCGPTDSINVDLTKNKIQINKIPAVENKMALNEFEKYFKKQRKEARIQKVKAIQKMNLNEIKNEIKRQIKKRTSKKFLNLCKKILHKLIIKQIVSGNYQIIKNPNKNHLKQTFENTWQDKSIPKQQIKITKKQINNYQQIPAMDTLVKSVKKLYPDGKKVLEVGCSTGYFSEIFKKADLNLHYEGCDYSQAFIDEARKEHNNIVFKTCDAINLNYKNEEFDIVISGCCLLHIVDYEKAIEESSRVAKDFVIFHRTPVFENNQTTYTEKIGYGKKMLEIIFYENQLLQLFIKHGLEPVETIAHGSFSIPGINEPVLIKEYICKKYDPSPNNTF